MYLRVNGCVFVSNCWIYSKRIRNLFGNFSFYIQLILRRAAINTFGYIAKAIGPHDVLATLLNNLKVQERQLRVCTTVAIAIVAETCAPFTVLPAIMNEYRVPEINVQNGVLKALAFMFEVDIL